MRQLRRLNELRRLRIHASDGDIGRLEEVYFDDNSWAVRYLIINTGSWLMGRRVLIAPMAISNIDEASGTLHLDLTRDQVEGSPPVDTEKPVSRQYEVEYYKHYGWLPYWDAGVMPGPRIPPPPVAAPQVEQAATRKAKIEESHLRSTAEVTGYYIEARDGEIGHVEDFVVDDQDWMMRYLEVDTRNWLPGKKVLVAPTWIESISWQDGTVRVDLEREVIKSAPAYDASKLISPDHEVHLYKYYSQHQNKGDVSS